MASVKGGTGCGHKSPHPGGILAAGRFLDSAGGVDSPHAGGPDGPSHVFRREPAGEGHGRAERSLGSQHPPVDQPAGAAEQTGRRSGCGSGIDDHHGGPATGGDGLRQPSSGSFQRVARGRIPPPGRIGRGGRRLVGRVPRTGPRRQLLARRLSGRPGGRGCQADGPDHVQAGEFAAAVGRIERGALLEVAMQLNRTQPRMTGDLQDLRGRRPGEHPDREHAGGEAGDRLAGGVGVNPSGRAGDEVEADGIGARFRRETGIGGRRHAADFHMKQRLIHGTDLAAAWSLAARHAAGAFRVIVRRGIGFLIGRVYDGSGRCRKRSSFDETNLVRPVAWPPDSSVNLAMHVPSRHPSSRPFMASPRPQFYHAAREIDGALRGIERCIRRAEGVGLVIGPPGTGKSLLLLKLTEHVRDDFDVALLTGASICTRRALWQAILAGIGEPYRGIDEGDLRIAVVERIRGLAAAGSGLVILVDEAHTLPTRLIEELRLLTNVPTPLPAVHIVLAGTTRLDEMLGAPRMESLTQRIAVRGYLEPLDHAETLAYLRTQPKAAGLEWERLFAEGCDDAIYRVTEGVPRLINQVCDQALVLVAECDRRVTAADIAAAWREIQRLPPPAGLEASGDEQVPSPAVAESDRLEDLGGEEFGVIELGGEDSQSAAAADEDLPLTTDHPAAAAGDLWGGPDVELVFGGDPFEEFFEREEAVAERYQMEGPEDFRGRRRVASQEGHPMGRLLATIEQDARDPSAADPAGGSSVPEPGRGFDDHDAAVAGAGAEPEVIDDSDMVVIEEDLAEPADAAAGQPTVFSVRPTDYRNLFTRLRRVRRG